MAEESKRDQDKSKKIQASRTLNLNKQWEPEATFAEASQNFQKWGNQISFILACFLRLNTSVTLAFFIASAILFYIQHLFVPDF